MTSLTYKAAVQIQKALPPARFQTYLQEAQGDVIRAAELYLWNIQAAGAVTALTGAVEVMFRHTIDKQLRNWNVSQGGTHQWIVAPHGLALAKVVRKDPPLSWSPTSSQPLPPGWWETKALANYDVQRPSAGGSSSTSPTHEDLVASLTFGAWTGIIVKPNVTSDRNPRLKLWNDSLSAGFKGLDRCQVYRYAHDLRWIRNRASHLRPMLDHDELKRAHKTSIRLLRSMDADYAQIVAGQAVIPDILKAKP